MGKITLSGAMPESVTNGLADHSKAFMDDPLRLVPIVALVSVDKITRKTRTGEEYPTIAIQHWEIVPEKARKQHAKILGDALGARTGAAELPFEAGAEIPMKDQFPEVEDVTETEEEADKAEADAWADPA